MDRPQTQIFQSGQNSYRFMKYPMQKQKLQLLYPGMPMSSNYHYNGDNIPNQYTDAVYDAKMQLAELSRIASRDEEAISRHLGGKGPVYDHASIEPEEPVEDLADFTKSTSVGTRGQSDIEMVRSNLPSLTELHREDISEVVAESKDYPRNVLIQKPRRYSWDEGFEFDPKNRNYKNNREPENSYLPHVCIGMMLLVAFGGIVMLMAMKRR